MLCVSNSNDRKCQEKGNGCDQLAFTVAIAEMLTVQLMNPLLPSPYKAGKRNKGEYSGREN
jgi:hypothetical protein